MITHDVEVLVAGMGPVGSVAALYLARRGISVAAIETRMSGSEDLRASTFHAPTLEMLDDLGATDVLIQNGLKAAEYQFRDRQSGEIFSFDLSEIADSTRFPYRLQCEQHVLSHHMADLLAKEPTATVAFNQRLLYVEQNDDHVIAYVETPTAVERYKARYLVGADGASSVTRKMLDLDFPGFTYDEKFLCLSTTYPVEDHFKDLCYVNYLSDPKEWMVLLRVPRVWRVLVPASQNDPDEMLLSDANKDAVFNRMLGSDQNIVTEHRTIYRVHQRVCGSFAQGRVCLAGDSAHLNSPMGGFGMNSGIHDAVSLSEKLVSILREGGDPALIGLYDRQRRAITNDFVQAQTIENTKMMKAGWTEAREGRRELMSRLQNDPAARKAYLLKQSMITSLRDAAAIQ